MKYILVDKNDNVILFITVECEEYEDYYYIDNQTRVSKELCNVFYVEVPEYVTVGKYCYVNGDFILNPNWPEKSEEE